MIFNYYIGQSVARWYIRKAARPEYVIIDQILFLAYLVDKRFITKEFFNNTSLSFYFLDMS